jgi:hypothetical protein
MCNRIPSDAFKKRGLLAERRRLEAEIGNARANAEGPQAFRVIARLESELDSVNAALRETRKRAA